MRTAFYFGLLAAWPANAGVIYVRAGTGGDGTSWARAFSSPDAALAAARDGDAVWVAAGTYSPTAGAGREASFQLREGVAVYGGFAGTETRLEQRDAARHLTVLSGGAARVYHVVRGADRAVLDGFTVRDGQALPEGPPGRGPGPGGPIHITPEVILRGPGAGAGGGMLNYRAAPTVRQCVFENNRAGKGGAVYNMTSTVFPPRPGAVSPAPVFIGCVFRRNQAQGRGGGVSNDLSTAPVFLDCRFEDNETPQKGGGMYNDFGCSPVLINCLFTGNRAESAAGMGNDGGSSPVLLHCTFTRNQARGAGPALYQGTGPSNNPAILRTVVWGNTCDWEDVGLYNWHDNAPRVEDSFIEGGYPGASAARDEVGYKPGDARFIESRLEELLRSLMPYRPAPPAPPAPAPRPAAVPSSERVVYVNGARGAAGDGRAWSTAYASLHVAIEDAARDGAEIWVAAGTYRPSERDRAVSFVLRPGVKLYGGFTGSETARERRDPAASTAVLSGEIGDPLLPEDNSYHVLIGADGAVLDGFTITGGYADGLTYDGKGGGLINYRRGPQQRPNLPVAAGFSTVVRNSVFTGNYARDGGAVYTYDRAKPRFERCVFRGNRAINGGAVVDRVGVEAVYQDCEFRGNRARWQGGAAYFDYGARPTITGTRWQSNFARGHGGAIYSASRASQLENTVVTLERCRFEDNTAWGDGGAAAFDDASVARATTCQFVINRALGRGGAVAVTNRSSLEVNGVRFGANAAPNGPDVYREQGGMLR